MRSRTLPSRWQRAPLLLVPLRSFRPFSQEFRVAWQGSLLAPETGEYEFRVKTENATKLSVNDMRRPLIDALVKSGNETEYRGSIYLLGGRAYPIRLELSRAKEMTSSIALEWKVPRRAFEVIPRTKPLAGVAAGDFRPDDAAFRPMIALPVMNVAHRSQRHGIWRQPMRQSRLPATWWLI